MKWNQKKPDLIVMTGIIIGGAIYSGKSYNSEVLFIGKAVIYMSPFSYGTCMYTIRPRDSLWIIARRFHTTVTALMLANPFLNENNLRIGQIISIPQGCKSQQMSSRPQCGSISASEQTLCNHMRLLWEQHVYWTRMLIISIAFNLPDTEFVAARLLRNPKDFEAALRPLYGEEIATKFADLFTGHLTIAAELVKAAKTGDNAAVADAEHRWYANADQIATFLGRINPYWSEVEWKKMIYDHLAMTKTEAVDILSQKWENSISTFEKIEQEALMMADVMTDGIIKQFPQHFR